MSATVNLIISAVNNASPALNGIRGSFTELNSSISTAKMIMGEVQRAFNETVGVTIKYAKQMRDLSRNIGVNIEDTSRMTQVADDYGISVESLTGALQMAVKRGFAPNIDSLAELADQYKTISDPLERARVLTEKFGRGWQTLTPMLDAGGDAIRKAGAAIDDSLIMTKEAAQQARDYEIALDALSDAMLGVKYTIGKELLPSTVQLLQTINLMITATGQINAAAQKQSQVLLTTSKSFDEYNEGMIEANKWVKEYNKLISWTAFINPALPFILAADALEGYTEAQYKAIEADEESGYATLEGIRLTRELGTTVSETTEEIEGMTQAEKDQIIATEALATYHENVKTAMSELQGYISGDLGPTIDDYNTKQQNIIDKKSALLAQIELLKSQGYQEEGKTIQGLRGELGQLDLELDKNAAAHEEATRRIIFSMLSQQAAADGLTGSEVALLTTIAYNWGLVDIATKTATDAMSQELDDFAHGQSMEDTIAAINGIQTAVENASGTYDIIFNISTVGEPPPTTSASGGTGEGGRHSDTADEALQTGGEGIVPPGFPNDSYLIGLTSGEHYKVSPPGARNGASVIMYNTFNVNDEADARMVAKAIASEIERMG